MKKVLQDIKRNKNKLISKAKTKGLYENFGVSEVRKLEEKYIDISSYTNEMNAIRKAISDFSYWCMCFDGNLS